MATKIYIKESFWIKPIHSVWLNKHIKSLKNKGKKTNRSARIRKYLDRQMKRYPQG